MERSLALLDGAGTGERGAEMARKGIAHPGGSTWMTGAYDPQLGIVYWTVGNPGPDLIGDDRLGDNLHRLGGGARRQDRRAEVALSVHAARRVGLRRTGTDGSRRHGVAGEAAEAAGAGEP